MQLAGEILKEATLPESEFEEIRKEQLTKLDFGKTEPQSLAFTGISRAMYPYPKGDVRATLSIPEEIEEVKAVKLEDAKAFYKKFCGRFERELAIVGDFDPAEVKRRSRICSARGRAPRLSSASSTATRSGAGEQENRDAG